MSDRKQEIKCFVLFTAVFIFAVFILAHEKLDQLLLLAIVLFVLAYLMVGLCIEYRAIREESKPIEIEMIVISSTDVCTICLEPCFNGVEIECGHIFHKKCIEKWTSLKQTCPNCRTSV